MKNMKKLVIASAAFLAFASSLVGVANMGSASAEGNDFYMDGASVRMADPSGIRFHTVVENKKDGYTYGTLLIPQADFTGETLTVDTPNVVDIPAINWKSETEYTTALGGLVKDGVISNFPKSQYNSTILACSYAKDENGTVVAYTETTSRTLAQVASIALTDTTENAVTDETARAYLTGICDYVLGEDGFALAQTSVEVVVGTYLDLTSVFATTNGNEGLKAIWEVTDGADYITVMSDELGAMTGVKATAEGTATLTATIGSYEVELTLNTKLHEVAENEVVDFKYAGDLKLANITKEGDVQSVEYVEEFQGAQGVLKVTANNWGRWGFDPLQEMSAYEGYNYLVVRMWVETTSTDGFMYIGNDYTSAACLSMTNISSGRWLNYYFKGETFRTQWADLGNYYSSMATNRAGSYYIDKIYMTNEMEVIDFTHATDVASSVNAGSAPFSYVDEFQGAQGVLKIDAASWGCWKFKAVMGGSNGYTYDNYAGAKYIVIRMYATNACNFQIAESNGGPKTQLILDGWTELYFDATAFMSQWVDTGSYYSALIFKSAGTYYIDKIYMMNSAPATMTVIDFNSANGISSSYVINQWDAPFSYVSEFQGAQGVLKVDAANYGCLSFKNLADLSFAKNYKYLVVRAWVDTAYASSGGNSLRLGYSSGEIITPVSGCWYEYKFDVAGFVSFWSSYEWTNYNASLTFGYASTWYIDSIYFAN